MDTETVPNAREFDVDDSEDLWHEAHIMCQVSSPFVTTLCGRVCNWDEMRIESNCPPCQACADMDHCPICGRHRAAPPHTHPPRT